MTILLAFFVAWIGGILVGAAIAFYITFTLPVAEANHRPDLGKVFLAFFIGACISGFINCTGNGFSFAVFLWGAAPVMLPITVLG